MQGICTTALFPMTLYRKPEDFDADFALVLPRGELLPPGSLSHLLLTGANGFLGRYTLLELLDSTAARITCLVRGGSIEAARSKLLRALGRAGWTEATLPDRVSVVLGDVERANLGMSAGDFRRLTRDVDSVLHGAAQIAWSLPYAELRKTNACGTREIVRFCCTARLKRLVFVSSIATRFSPMAPGTIDENSDMRPFVHTMPLGYGQSKCVAEAQVERLAELGAPVSILRPGLISGHSRTGAMNDDDFVARMLVCVANERRSPDLDLLMDCVAVDEVARISVANLRDDPETFSNRRPGVRRLHILSPDAPSWPELVATLNLFCAGVRLEPWERWLAHINGRARSSRHVLNPLRPFLLGRLAWDKSVRTPEMYCSSWQRRIDSRASRRWIAERGLCLSVMDGPVLERSLAYLARKGRITLARRFSTCAWTPTPAPGLTAGPESSSLIDWLAARAPGHVAPGARAVALRQSADGGLTSRVAGWRHGAEFRNSVLEFQPAAPVELERGERQTVFIKHTPAQDTVNLLGAALGELVSPELGALLARHMPLLDFDQAALRELAAYGPQGPAARSGHAPALLGAQHFDDNGMVRLALQCLPESSLIPEAGWTRPWAAARAQPILDAMTSWQSPPTLRQSDGLYRAPDASALIAARSLWPALGGLVHETIQRWTTGLERRTPLPGLPATLPTLAAALPGVPAALPGFAASFPGLATSFPGLNIAAFAMVPPPLGTATPTSGLCAHVDALLLRVDEHFHACEALPATFIHNDFNPRNLAVVTTPGGGSATRIVAFDWQLCCYGPPVRDLVDFLCFALDRHQVATELPTWLEGHRCALEKAHGLPWPRDQWLAAFELALDDWLLRRLPLYALHQRVRPQAFLPRIVENWWAMRRAGKGLSPALLREAAAVPRRQRSAQPARALDIESDSRCEA